jgi:hypothetical protein
MVRIEIKDEVSRVRFFECKIAHADLMQGLMGLAERPVTFKVKDLDKVGKTKYSQTLQVEISNDCGYGDDRRKHALERIEWEVARIKAETGIMWECTDRTLSSQDSFPTIDGTHYVKTTISHWE